MDFLALLGMLIGGAVAVIAALNDSANSEALVKLGLGFAVICMLILLVQRRAVFRGSLKELLKKLL